jgi:hypothetical protein
MLTTAVAPTQPACRRAPYATITSTVAAVGS